MTRSVTRTQGAHWAFWRLAGLAAMLVATGTGADLAHAQGNEKISSTVGLDFSHAYFFRGIKQERDGAVLQPYADINFDVYSDDDGSGLNGATFTIGTWNSLHSGPSGADGSAANTKAWYESDFFTGVTMEIDNWEAGVTYTSYLSPNDSFGTVQELALGLAMDDTALLGQFSLQPHVLLAIETNGQADGGDSEGVYLEFGVEPGLDIVEDAASVSFPITLGLSLSNYYENGIDTMMPGGFSDTFGYFDVAAVVAVPLSMPPGYGSWELSGGFHLLMLGSYLEELNDSDGVQIVGSFGVSIGF